MPQTTLSEQRLTWPDNLRALATMAVIVLHVSSTVLYEFEKVSNFDWWTGNIYDSLVRWCVPVFLMVTGALLIPKQNTFSEFIQKRIGKILMPFAFWSFIYLVILIYKHIMYANEIGSLHTIQIMLHGSSYHLWYIYMLLGVYIVLPLISKKIQIVSDKNLLFIIMLWFLVLGLNYVPNFSLKPAVHVFLGYLGYTVFGYYLSRKNISNSVGLMLFLAGIIITSWGTFYLSNQQHSFNELLYKYTTPHIAMMAAGVFILIKNNMISDNTWLAKIKNIIAQHSLGIYLIHVLILEILNGIGLDWYFVNPLLGVPLTSICCLGISTAIVYYCSKNPAGKYIFG